MNRRTWLGIIASGALLAGAAVGTRAIAGALAVGATAPDVAGGPWIGSAPLTLAGLRGRVVLVEFWTHG